MKIIQMIWTSPTECIFLLDFKDGELYFRSSYNLVYLQHEKPTISQGKVHLSLYFFAESLLTKFINDNQ